MVQQTYISLIAVGLLLIVLGIIRLRNVSLQGLIFGLSGAITGLIIGALASLPLAQLPHPYGSALPILVSLLLMALILMITQRQASMEPTGRFWLAQNHAVLAWNAMIFFWKMVPFLPAKESL